MCLSGITHLQIKSSLHLTVRGLPTPACWSVFMLFGWSGSTRSRVSWSLSSHRDGRMDGWNYPISGFARSRQGHVTCCSRQGVAFYFSALLGADKVDKFFLGVAFHVLKYLSCRKKYFQFVQSAFLPTIPCAEHLQDAEAHFKRRRTENTQDTNG